MKPNVIHLEQCNSVLEVRDIIVTKIREHETSVLFYEGEIIGAAVSADIAKDLMCRSIIDRWAKKPGEFKDVFKRLEIDANDKGLRSDTD